MSEPINHEEAEHLAILKQGESNLARCYLDHVKRIEDLVAALRAALNMVDGDGTPPDWDALRKLVKK